MNTKCELIKYKFGIWKYYLNLPIEANIESKEKDEVTGDWLEVEANNKYMSMRGRREETFPLKFLKGKSKM